MNKRHLPALIAFLILLSVTTAVAAKTVPGKARQITQTGRLTVEVIAGQDTLTALSLSGFTEPPVVVCGGTDQVVLVMCQSLGSDVAGVWVRSVEFTGQMTINWIAEGE